MHKRFTTWLLACALLSVVNAQNNTTEPPKLSKPPKFTFHGNVGLGASFYHNPGGVARNRPATWQISGTPVITLFGHQAPFSFMLSEQDRQFMQPFNQVGLSPQIKWFTAHLGFRNLYFSNFTLSGATMAGAGFEMNPKKFRMGLFYGRLNRAVTNLDSIAGFGIQGQPTFRRMGLAGKIGYGKQNSFFDLVFLKGWDEQRTVNNTLTDSLGIRPAENLVVGINSRLAISKSITWEIDAALSGFTADRRERLADGDYNKTFLKELFPQRFSSNFNLAGKTALSYFKPKFGLRLEYRRIEPNFQSMGMYFIQTDLQQFTLSPNFSLFKHKVRFFGSVGFEQDNLSKVRDSGSERLISQAGVSFNPGKGKYGLDVNYSNFGITQTPGLRPLNDTIRLAQNNANINISNRLAFVKTKRVHSVVLNTSFQSLTDLNRFTSTNNDNKNYSINLLYANSGVKRGGIGYQASFNYNTFLTNVLAFDLVGGNVGLNYGHKKGKYTTGLNTSYQININDGEQVGAVTNVGINIQVQPFKQHGLRFQTTWLNSTNSKVASQAFNEIFGNVSYLYTF